ncbi:UNVERIFIED_CONTAM: hypothetical protein Scaly_1652200 [Sesamum calycinum]|uniref:Uncharacterized protein n=1 Tax=Sesamum calycinum TaxID=2727403 RepID=A0AAW2NTQ1_9LAMI
MGSRYKPARGRDPHRKKSSYAVLRTVDRRVVEWWHVGVRMYENATNRAFMMRVVLIWTVNDLPAYGMASGWSTARVMGCPVCMDDTRVFYLQHGRKACYFDCHKQFLPTHHLYRRNKKAFTKNPVENKVTRPRLTRDQILDRIANIHPAVEMPLLLPDGYGSNHKWTNKSIFWDLPYWSTLFIRHKLVMHIEKNAFDNIFNKVTDIKGKTKDNMNARRDLKIICNRLELELDKHRSFLMDTRLTLHEASLRLLRDRQAKENNSEEQTPSSQGSVTPLRAATVDVSSGRRKRSRVFGLGSKAHHTIAGPSQPSSSTAPTPSPPQPQSDDLRDRVQMIERYIRSRDPDWPDRIVSQPPADAIAPDDKRAPADGHDLD